MYPKATIATDRMLENIDTMSQETQKLYRKQVSKELASRLLKTLTINELKYMWHTINKKIKVS